MSDAPDLTDPRQVLSRTLYGEARGQGQSAIEAVCSIILNRARNPRWWGKSIVDVCLKPYQFSCWLEDDPNHAKLLAVTDADAAFQECLAVADLALGGTLPDATGNCDSYFDISIPPPSWARGKTPTLVLGSLRFYRLELAAP